MNLVKVFGKVDQDKTFYIQGKLGNGFKPLSDVIFSKLTTKQEDYFNSVKQAYLFTMISSMTLNLLS